MSQEQNFTSVWDAIEDTVSESMSMKARSSLMMALQEWVKVGKRTQAEAALLLGVTQPRMSDLVRGKITLFSLESLLNLAALAGLNPHLTVDIVSAEKVATDWEDERSLDEHPISTSNGFFQSVRPDMGESDKFLSIGASGAQASVQESRLTLVKRVA